MAELLNDVEIRRILGTVIQDGVEDSVRPNSYVLRLGSAGEFITTGKEFDLGREPNKKKGIKVSPGQSVALTALETIDFTRETVHSVYPDRDLHAFISPTTDLQREGVVAATTQIDAGYRGTLNWTLSNSSSEERRFVYGERLFRLSIFKLAEGERPDSLYAGAYQDKTGYVRSERSGAPVGMRPTDWEDGTTEAGPAALLDRVIQSGFPWNALGTKLKAIDDQFQVVSNEYASIHDSIEHLQGEVGEIGKEVEQIRTSQGNLTDRIRQVVREELPAMQDRWLIAMSGVVFVLVGIAISVLSSTVAKDLLAKHGPWIGPLVIVTAMCVVWWARRLRKPRND